LSRLARDDTGQLERLVVEADKIVEAFVCFVDEAYVRLQTNESLGRVALNV
jgi:hypothetical protein